MNRKLFDRNQAIALAIVALGGVPKQPGLSPIQQKVLRGLRNGTLRMSVMRMDHPAFDTVVLPNMLKRGLIKLTKEHPDDRRVLIGQNGLPRLTPIEHEDIDITEEGLLTLYCYEQHKSQVFATMYGKR